MTSLLDVLLQYRRHQEALATGGTNVWKFFRVNRNDVIAQRGTLVKLGTTLVALVRLLAGVGEHVPLKV